jgi:AcrR family transcriptional regulator
MHNSKAMPHTGRRPGPTTSRDAILEAARRQFAEAGYELTSIRSIAAEAEVNAALVVHFFGSKEQLFRAAVTWPFDPAELMPRILGPGTAGLGERLTRVFLTFWDDPETSPRLLALLRSAMTNESFARLLREFVVTQLFQHLAEVVEGPDRELREELAAAHLLGIAVLRRVLRVEPLASASVDEVASRVGPVLDRYLQRA